MARHVPRDHLISPGGRSYCGHGKSMLQLEAFLASANRCRHCEAACEGFPPVHPRKVEPIRYVAIRPNPEVSAVLDRLASGGILGESIVALLEWAIDSDQSECLDSDRDSVLCKFWRKD